MSDRYASLKQGLVGCWIPSVSGSGLLLPDLSLRGNNGDISTTGANFVSTTRGVGLQMDQRATEFNPVPINGTDDFTVSIWTNLSTSQSASDLLVPVFGQKAAAAANAGWMVVYFYGGANAGKWLHSTANGTNASEVLTSATANTQGSLAHIVMRRSAAITNNGDFYINGIQYSLASSSTLRDVTTTSKLRFSADASGFRATNQTVLDARVYSRLLSEPEIRLLASEPGIGFKRISSSAFATRYAYKPAKPRNYSVIRNRDPNYSTLRQGLVAAYCPSISGQGNVLPDLVGGNHGTLTNMTADDWVSSGDGRALDFDGVDDSVKSNRILPNLTPAFTLSLWVYVRSLPTSGSIVNILSTYYSTGSQLFGFDLRFRNDAGIHKLGLRGGDGTNTTELGSDEVYELPTLRWINLLFTVTSSGAIGYQDSIQIATYSTMRGVPMNANKNLSVGSLGAYSSPGQELGRFFNGVMDDIRIYNRALSEPEIKLLASKRGIGLEPRKPKITFTDLGVQKTYSVVRVKETDYATLRQGLVGAWCPSLPNGGSGNTLPDVSGYGNHGTLTNMSPDDWVSGQYGRALDFDGVNDYIRTADSTFDFTDKFSIAFWCNIRGGRIPLSKGDAGSTGYNFDFGGFTANQIEFLVIASSGNYISRGFENPGGWVHVVGMFDSTISGTGRNMLFINGIQRTGTVVSAGTVNAVSTNNSALIFGTETSVAVFFNGQLDDVRAYNRILTDSEIRLLASRPGIGLRQESHRQTFYQFPSFQPALARRSSAIIGGGIT